MDHYVLIGYCLIVFMLRYVIFEVGLKLKVIEVDIINYILPKSSKGQSFLLAFTLGSILAIWSQGAELEIIGQCVLFMINNEYLSIIILFALRGLFLLNGFDARFGKREQYPINMPAPRLSIWPSAGQYLPRRHASKLFALLFIIQCSSVSGQNELLTSNLRQFTFDFTKGSSPELIPFDEAFVANFILAKEDIPLRLFVYDLRVEYSVDRVYVPTLNIRKPLDTKMIEKLGAQRYFAILNPLRPDQNYDMVLTFGFNVADKEELSQVFYEFHRKNGRVSEEARLLFGKLFTRLNHSPYRGDDGNSLIYYFRANLQENNLNTNLLKYYEVKIQPSLDKLIDFKYTKDLSPINEADFQEILTEVGKEQLDSKAVLLLQSFLKDKSNQEEIFKGLRQIRGGDQFTKEIDKYNFQQRIKNLEESIAYVKELVPIFRFLTTSNSKFQTYKKLVTNLGNSLFENAKHIQVQLKQISDTIDKNGKLATTDEEAIFQYGKWLSTSTLTKGFSARNGKIVIPDFGLTNVFAHSRNYGVAYLPRPYVGINLMLRPIDKFKDLEEVEWLSGWYRWSITLGVSLGSINELDFSDFYNNMSLMIGANYRIHEQIRLGAGAAFLRERNPNPIVDSQRIEPGLYLLATFDFEVLDVLPNVVGKIFK